MTVNATGGSLRNDGADFRGLPLAAPGSGLLSPQRQAANREFRGI
jgi:hypothetical protein